MDFVPTLLGAVLLWDFFSRVMQGVTTAFVDDVWSRNFLNVFASPLTIAEYISGLVLTSVITRLVGLLVRLVLARSDEGRVGQGWVGPGGAGGVPRHKKKN